MSFCGRTPSIKRALFSLGSLSLSPCRGEKLGNYLSTEAPRVINILARGTNNSKATEKQKTDAQKNKAKPQSSAARDTNGTGVHHRRSALLYNIQFPADVTPKNVRTFHRGAVCPIIPIGPALVALGHVYYRGKTRDDDGATRTRTTREWAAPRRQPAPGHGFIDSLSVRRRFFPSPRASHSLTELHFIALLYILFSGCGRKR